MAREKNSTFATEGAIPDEEQPATFTTKVVTPPGKKKALGKRGGDVDGSGNNNGGLGSASRSVSQKSGTVLGNGKSGTTSGRGNKTLGWFLNDVIFESTNKANAENPSSSPIEVKTDAGTRALNDRTFGNKATMHDDNKKRGKRSRQRLVKKSMENKLIVSAQDETTAGKMTPKCDYSRDDYWYYDSASNGYYYEQMGSRGWRRHSPAAEQKRLQMEQEMIKFWREAGGLTVPPHDPYGTMSLNQTHFAAPQIKYDAESDGFYFEMPSVDGWKKRQPNSNSSSSISSSGSVSKCSPSFPHVAFAESQPISYGAALARGQLPPACTVVPSVTYLPEPFSSDTSSMTTLSEGAPTPPPRSFCSMNGSAEQERIDAMLAEHYETALKVDDAFSSTMTGFDACDNSSFIPSQHDSQQSLSSLSLKKQPTSYADVAAPSCTVKEKKENVLIENRELHRPANLQLSTCSLGSDESNENENMVEHDLLLNFNADKFISDLLSCCPSPQRFMRDLAALKTPVAAPPLMFSLDAPADGFDIRSPWSSFDESGKCGLVDNTWSTNSFENERSNFNGDLRALSGNLDYQPPEKSKLSIWCNNNLLTSTLIDK